MAEACALCFPAGTLVSTPHGAQAIQTLHVGDTVLSENPATGKVEPEAVQAVITDPVSPLIVVDLSDGSAITVTADHPFWLDGGMMAPEAGWIQAGDLLLGDRLRTPTGADVVVLGVRRGVGQAAVYTLTVTKDHTFFVGAARVLVHNAGGGACTLVRSLVKKIPPLYEIAQGLGENPRWRAEANNLVQQYIRGNRNPGIGTNHLFGAISYLRGRNGARIFFRAVGGDSFEILAYADKSTEPRVIALLELYYGGR